MMSSLQMYLSYPFVQHALIAGVLIALCSSLLGVTLVLKRFSLIGDGLSHVAFGALAIATVFRLGAPMLFVLPATILCAIVLLCASQSSRIRGDASIAMLSVGSLAIGYLLLNIFGSSANLSGDVCSTLFGSTSILTLSKLDVWLCVLLSATVVIFFTLFYERIFAVTFDETFARACGVHTGFCNLLLAAVVAVIIVLAMNLVGSLLISALIVFPALAAMRVCQSFLGVTICAAMLSMACALTGLLTAILCGTPVGSTIVAADMVVFLLCALLGTLLPRLRLRKLLPTVSLALLLLPCHSCSQSQPSTDTKETSAIAATPVDLDLTQVNPMMVYTQVFYMMQKPQDYANQSIRIQGICTITEDRHTRQKVANCNISDATGCCAKMIPFRLANPNAILPREGSTITVVGRFEVITEGGKSFGLLTDATLE